MTKLWPKFWYMFYKCVVQGKCPKKLQTKCCEYDRKVMVMITWWLKIAGSRCGPLNDCTVQMFLMWCANAVASLMKLTRNILEIVGFKGYSLRNFSKHTKNEQGYGKHKWQFCSLSTTTYFILNLFTTQLYTNHNVVMTRIYWRQKYKTTLCSNIATEKTWI
jgi:hypothetical protein